MAKTYYTVLTTYGAQLFAQSIAQKKAVPFKTFAVGDGNGKAVQPDSTRTTLVRETWRANISAISKDPRNNKQVIFELTIPEDIGGFYVREMGLFDENNKLVAYANCPESFKPQLTEGSGKVQVLRMVLLVSSSDAVTVTVDDSVIFVTRSQLTPKTITSNTKNGVDETGHTHEIELASLTTKGLVQLTNDTGLDSESLALTAKGAKAIAQQIAQNKLAVDNGFIQNGKKSDTVNSASSDTVATSKAVKTAYDKGVEAKTAADNANNNASGRVSKNGDTMAGVFNIDYGDYSSINQWNSSRKHARTETLPDSHTNFYKISYRGDNGNSELHSVHFPKRGAGKNAAYEDWVNSNYIPRSGDTTINGRHFFKNGTSWIGIVSTDSTSAGLDYTVTNGKFAQCSIRAVDIGKFSNEFQFYTTPPGSNYDTDRRQRAMTLGYGGHIWTLAYGWLQDFFAKQNDITNVWNELNNKVVKRSDFTRTWYASHYAGTEVYKIKHLGLMITLMKTQSMGARELYLPEAYDGHAIVLAQDRGAGNINVAGNDMVGNNKVKVGGRSDTSLSVLVIGFKNIP